MHTICIIFAYCSHDIYIIFTYYLYNIHIIFAYYLRMLFRMLLPTHRCTDPNAGPKERFCNNIRGNQDKARCRQGVTQDHYFLRSILGCHPALLQPTHENKGLALGNFAAQNLILIPKIHYFKSPLFKNNQLLID